MAAIPRFADSSPTATLLRNSRLFSLPQPIPRPDLSQFYNGRYRDSNTATTPYPTHQIIATTDASRSRGDWGLKRALPLKSTHTSRGIRMRSLDTYDQITDFENGRDHLMTLKKLQELNVSFTRDATTIIETHRGRPSAFEPTHDNTAPQSKSFEDAVRERSGAKTYLPHRWRARGPEVQLMSQAEFDNYVSRELDGRQAEFEHFLKTHRVREFVAEHAEHIYDEGRRSPDLVKEYIKWLDHLTLPALEVHLTSRCNSQSMPASVRDWFKVPNLETTPAWMPARPSKPPSFESQLSAGGLRHTIIHGRRSRLTTEQPEMHNIDVENEATPAALDFRYARELAEIPVSTDYSEEEVSYVKTLRQAAEKRLFDRIGLTVVKEWPSWLLNFRNTCTTNNAHRHLIEYFLDLPLSGSTSLNVSPNLSTHPSAGLSYRRTNRSIDNHPIYGPLLGSQAVKSRVLPRGQAVRRAETNIGFGGNVKALAGLIVSSDSGVPMSWDMVSNNTNSSFDARAIKTSDRGTPEEWSTLKDAWVTTNGRVVLNIEKASQPVITVAEKLVEDEVRLDEEASNDPMKNARKVGSILPLNMPSALVQAGRVREPLDSDEKSAIE